MPIRYLKKHAALEGVVSAEEAEALSNWIRERRQPAVHLGRCDQVHSAVLQVLLALKPRIVAAPSERWLAQTLAAST